MFSQSDPKMKIFTNIIAKEPLKVTIQTATNQLEGNIYIRPEERLKDEMNQYDQFIAVTDVKIYNLQHEIVMESKFIILNRDQIIWIAPEGEAV